jgi:hypothetical protein
MSWQERKFYFEIWTGLNYFFNMRWHSLQAFVDKPVSGHPSPHVK